CVLAQQRSLAISLGGTYVVWIALTAIITASHWALGPALLINAAAITVGIWVVRSFRHTRMPRQQPRGRNLGRNRRHIQFPHRIIWQRPAGGVPGGADQHHPHFSS